MSKENSKSTDIGQSVEAMQELEQLLHHLSEKMDATKLKDGEDLIPHLEKLKVKVPGFLQDAEIVYADHSTSTKKTKQSLVMVTTPDKVYPDAIARKIFCIRWRGWVACLECGWIWCKVVIYVNY